MKPQVFIGIPAYRGVQCPTVEMLLQAFREFEARKWGVAVSFASEVSLIHYARAFLVGHFLRVPGATHLLFVDTDVAFDAKLIAGMVEADADIVALACVARDGRSVNVTTFGPTGKDFLAAPCRVASNGQRLLEVKSAGTGAMLIKRAVFERLYAKHPELHFSAPVPGPDPQPHCSYFDTFVRDGVPYGEDFAFCERARDAGFKIEILRSSVTMHEKQVLDFGASLDALEAVERPATVLSSRAMRALRTA